MGVKKETASLEEMHLELCTDRGVQEVEATTSLSMSLTINDLDKMDKRTSSSAKVLGAERVSHTTSSHDRLGGGPPLLAGKSNKKQQLNMQPRTHHPALHSPKLSEGVKRKEDQKWWQHEHENDGERSQGNCQTLWH